MQPDILMLPKNALQGHLLWQSSTKPQQHCMLREMLLPTRFGKKENKNLVWIRSFSYQQIPTPLGMSSHLSTAQGKSISPSLSPGKWSFAATMDRHRLCASFLRLTRLSRQCCSQLGWYSGFGRVRSTSTQSIWSSSTAQIHIPRHKHDLPACLERQGFRAWCAVTGSVVMLKSLCCRQVAQTAQGS